MNKILINILKKILLLFFFDNFRVWLYFEAIELFLSNSHIVCIDFIIGFVFLVTLNHVSNLNMISNKPYMRCQILLWLALDFDIGMLLNLYHAVCFGKLWDVVYKCAVGYPSISCVVLSNSSSRLGKYYDLNVPYKW